MSSVVVVMCDCFPGQDKQAFAKVLRPFLVKRYPKDEVTIRIIEGCDGDNCGYVTDDFGVMDVPRTTELREYMVRLGSMLLILEDLGIKL